MASPTDVNWKVSHLFKAGLLKCVPNETCFTAKQGYTSMKRHGRACQSPSCLRCCYCWAIRDLLINSAANHRSPCFRLANLDFITDTYGTSTVHYCSALAPWPSGNLIPARRQVNWNCLKFSLSGCTQRRAQVRASLPTKGSMCFVLTGCEWESLFFEGGEYMEWELCKQISRIDELEMQRESF